MEDAQTGTSPKNVTDTVEGIDEIFGEQPDNDGELGGLFEEEEDFSEAELTGEEATDDVDTKEGDEKAEAEAKAAEEGKKKGEEGAKAEKEAKEKAESESKESSDDSKPSEEAKETPAGFVPADEHNNVKTALRQERSNVRQLQSTVAEQAQVIQQLQEGDREPFKRLSKEELDELIEDDPDEAREYIKRERDEDKREEALKLREEELAERDRRDQEAVDDALDMMVEKIPGIFDDKQTVARDLTQFAVNLGVEADVLDALTDPSTLFLPPNGKDVAPLGKAAAQVVTMIHKLYESSKSTDPAKIRAELREEITAEVTKDFLAKLKKDPKAFYKDISQVPGESKTPAKAGGLLSEAEMAKMTPEEEEAYLMGE